METTNGTNETIETTETNGTNEAIESKSLKCGIIMPISQMPGYTAEHWLEVKSIIIEAVDSIEGVEFETEIVSNSNGEIDVIHKRIIQNIYNADIVVCDISGRNPNVLFELGMRLTFDKPTVLIKDDQTDFIFDTGLIEHLTYPRDLHYRKIVSFKKDLARRVEATYQKAKTDPDYSTFLKSFGEFKVPALEQTTVTGIEQVILDELSSIRSQMSRLKNDKNINSNKRPIFRKNELNDAIKEYVNIYDDFDDPNVIVDKKEFADYINDFHGIQINVIDNKLLVRLINNIQKELLPF